jgi:hypothetical protein
MNLKRSGLPEVVNVRTRMIIPRLITSDKRKGIAPVGSIRRVAGSVPSYETLRVGALRNAQNTTVSVQTHRDLRRLARKTGQAMCFLTTQALEEFFVKYRVPSRALFAHQRRLRAERKVRKALEALQAHV